MSARRGNALFCVFCRLAFVFDVWVSERGIICVLCAALRFQESSRVRQRWMQVLCPSRQQGKLEGSNLTKNKAEAWQTPTSQLGHEPAELGLFHHPQGENLGYHGGKTTCGVELPVFLRSCELLAALSEKVCCSLPVGPHSPPQPSPYLT